MAQLVASQGAMVQVLQGQARHQDRRSDIDRDKHFNLSRTIPKITANSASQLLEEMEEFETEYYKTNPRNIKDWVLGLNDALEGRAKQWRDFAILQEPGRGLYEATLRNDATAQQLSDFYRYIRAELFHLCGLRYEVPGESTKKRWKAITFPKEIKHKEDLSEPVDEVIQVYQAMVRHGITRAGNAEDERNLVIDLGEKIQRGSAFYMWFYGQET